MPVEALPLVDLISSSLCRIYAKSCTIESDKSSKLELLLIKSKIEEAVKQSKKEIQENCLSKIVLTKPE